MNPMTILNLMVGAIIVIPAAVILLTPERNITTSPTFLSFRK
jgi:hypothetical protein